MKELKIGDRVSTYSGKDRFTARVTAAMPDGTFRITYDHRVNECVSPMHRKELWKIKPRRKAWEWWMRHRPLDGRWEVTVYVNNPKDIAEMERKGWTHVREVLPKKSAGATPNLIVGVLKAKP